MAGTILHMGEDLCRRIPVMESAGFAVFQSEVKIQAIHRVFDREEDYFAVVFHNDLAVVSEEAVHEARLLSEAPLILFQNPTVAGTDGADEEFDLVIPALTPPNEWLQKLREVIEACREARERSQLLRQDYAEARLKARRLHSRSCRNLIPAIDPDATWRGHGDGLPEAKPPEESWPEKFGEKAG